MITGIALALFSLFGYTVAAHRWLKMPFRLSPLFTICVLMLMLFWGALADLVLPVTAVSISCGCLCGLYMVWVKISGHRLVEEPRASDSLLLLSGLTVLAILCALAGRLSVIDDYAYWAIISKSIAFYDALPASDTTIFPRHLTYTPGLALFHYYFFVATSGFSLIVAYVAQNLLLAALLLALTDGLNRRISLIIISVTITILVLFSGSVFQKLRVDHFLYLITASLVWTQMTNSHSLPRLAVVCAAAGCLYLVKEVGFLLAIFVFFVVCVDLLTTQSMTKNDKTKSAAICLLLLFLLVFNKFIWDRHCVALAFNQFHSSISMEVVRSAFSIFEKDESRKAFSQFIKFILIGPADRLHLPYLVWYVLLFFIWRRAFLRFTREESRRQVRLIILSLVTFVVYLLMNYVMQVGIFGLGTTSQQTVSLERYINIFFCWFALYTLFTGLVSKFGEKWSKRRLWYHCIIGCALLLLVVSSVTKSMKNNNLEIEALWPKIQQTIETDSRLCITPGKIEDHYIGFQMLYYLFPVRVNVEPFPGANQKNSLEQKLDACDYLLVYQPDGQTKGYFTPYTSTELSHKSLYRVEKQSTGLQKLALQPVSVDTQ